MSIGRYAENLGAPDIRLEGLQIWIHGRQFSKEEDYWGGNWLNVTAHCGAQGADVWISGSILQVPDMACWLLALEAMNQSLSGQANLVGLEPQFHLELSMKGLGQIAMLVEITPDYMTQEHKFEFEIDQSYLPGLIENCRKVLAKYPVKGKSDSDGET